MRWETKQEEVLDMMGVPENADRARIRELMHRLHAAGGKEADFRANEQTYMEIGKIVNKYLKLQAG